MVNNLSPFNISLLTLKNPEDLRGIRPVKVLDIFDGFSRNFHPDGLFSIETFGKVGEERRNRMFSYIDIRLDIFHPIVFKALGDLKGLYVDILSGKEYAKFNKETNDFEKADLMSGETGYNFFMKHFKQLKFEQRPSAKREFNIKLIEKYRNDCTFNKFVVIPAGMRDYIIDDANKPSEDEINGLYRKVLATANLINNVDIANNAEYLDTIRYNLQLAINDVYEYIKVMMDGKSKLVLGKWASRKVFNSTRNVITSYIPQVQSFNDVRTVSKNQTVVGLYQFLRAILPLAVKNIRDNYLSNVFVGPNVPAVLVNKKTLRKEMISLDSEDYDEWMTFEGIEKVLARFGQENLRHEYLQTDTHYFGLLFKSNNGGFKFIQDINDIPASFIEAGKKREDYVTPITFAELLYMSIYKISDKIPCFVTRYPITGYGSIYPSYTYLKTTTKSEIRYELNDNWELDKENIAKEFPVFQSQFFNSVSPSPSHIGRLGADYDGDTVSFTCVISDEAIAEIKKKLNSRDFYVGVNNKMSFSCNTDIISLVLSTMTS